MSGNPFGNPFGGDDPILDLLRGLHEKPEEERTPAEQALALARQGREVARKFRALNEDEPAP